MIEIESNSVTFVPPRVHAIPTTPWLYADISSLTEWFHFGDYVVVGLCAEALDDTRPLGKICEL